jgi:hypothetical protein
LNDRPTRVAQVDSTGTSRRSASAGAATRSGRHDDAFAERRDLAQQRRVAADEADARLHDRFPSVVVGHGPAIGRRRRRVVDQDVRVQFVGPPRPAALAQVGRRRVQPCGGAAERPRHP